MRTLVLVLLLAVSCSVAVALPSQKPPAHRPIRVVLVNMSAQRRYVEGNHGMVELPIGKSTVVDSRVGFTLRIGSDTNRQVDERFLLKEGDDARILRVR